MTDFDVDFARRISGCILKPFRGDLLENAKRFRLVGPAYRSMPPEQGGYFSIETARQLAGPLAALHDSSVREVGIIGATQVLKSVAGNVWLPHIMEHDPGDALVLFENDDKAQDFASRRLMPTILGHPNLSARLEDETDMRHDVTRTKIISPSMSLLCGGLNDSNVSTFSYRYVWVSESWQHKSDGMLFKAIKRTDRYADSCKILIESQAGLAGEDLHTWTRGAHSVPLTWECPCCCGRQTWEFQQLRPADFKTLPRLHFPDGVKPPQQEPAPDTYAGMKFDDGERVVGDKLVRVGIDERARTSRWECYHCGAQIYDRPELRRAIARTYDQNYKVTTADGFSISPRSVVFFLPKEAAWDNTFEASARSYLIAHEAQRRGNDVPIQNWYLNERAVFYDPLIGRAMRATARAEYDTEMAKHDAWRLCLVADNQMELMHQWVSVWGVKKDGSSRQLWRGVLKGLDEVRKKQLEYGTDARGNPVLKDQWVFLDGKYKHDEIVKFIFQNKCGHWGSVQGNREWLCWNLLHGSPRFDFTHREEKNDRVRFPVSDEKEDWGSVDGYGACVLTYEFSATQCGDMAVVYRDGRGPETLFLPRRPDEPDEDEPLSWQQQINSHHLVKINNPRHGISEYVYQPIRKMAPDHYWHILRMFMAIHYIWRIDGAYQKTGLTVASR